MPDALRIVLCGTLTAKWQQLPPRLARGGLAVTTYNGKPSDVLRLCRRIAPCTLIVPEAFVDYNIHEELCRVIDFGRSIRVLVEVKSDDSSQAESLVRIGCAGLISEEADLEQAVRALSAVSNGELWIRRRVMTAVLQKLLREAAHHLTFRETQILRLLSEGLKNSEIAERLFISPQTVRWHLRSLYRKLGTHDRVAAWAQEPVLG